MSRKKRVGQQFLRILNYDFNSGNHIDVQSRENEMFKNYTNFHSSHILQGNANSLSDRGHSLAIDLYAGFY